MPVVYKLQSNVLFDSSYSFSLSFASWGVLQQLSLQWLEQVKEPQPGMGQPSMVV